LINIHHVRFSALATILVLSMVVLTTINGSQNSAFAQNVTSTLIPSQLPAQDSTSTPTTSTQDSTPPETSDSNDDLSSSEDDNSNSSPSITPATEHSDSNEDSSSSGNNGDNNNGNGDDDSGDDSNSQQDTSSSDDEEAETEGNFEQTNPLLEQIRNNVNGTLFSSGIVVP
jgi:hypothetical protein